MLHQDRPPPRPEGNEHDFAFLVRKVRDGVPYERAIMLVWPPVSVDWCLQNEDRVKFTAKTEKYR